MVAYWKHWKLLLMFSNLTQPECNKTSASYQVLPKQMCDLWKLASADVISHIFLCQLTKRNQISKYCFLIGCHSNMNWFVTKWHAKTEEMHDIKGISRHKRSNYRPNICNRFIDTLHLIVLSDIHVRSTYKYAY